MTDYQRYLSTLFRANEGVCVTDAVQGVDIISVEDAIALKAPRQFVSVNPLHTKRLDANVTAHRNFLFEFDCGTIEEQLDDLVKKRVPYTSLVYSGGKSVHCIISLEESVSPQDYQHLFRLVRYVLWRSDPTSKNPSRLTRCAGADRDGSEQTLIDLRRRVSRGELDGWLTQFSAHIARCQAREADEQAAKEAQRQARAEGLGLAAVDPMTLKFLRGEISTRSSRHLRLVAAACELAECGVEYAEALALLQQGADAQGITADPKRANEAEEVAAYAYKR